MHKELAKIVNTFLGYEDHGIFTSIVTVDYESGGTQGIGLYALDQYDKESKRRVGSPQGIEFLTKFLNTVGVDKWEDLKGRTVYVLKESDKWGAKVLGIAQVSFPSSGQEFIFEELWNVDV